MIGLRINGLVVEPGGEWAIMVARANGRFGYVLERNSVGDWVSKRKATESEIRSAFEFAKQLAGKTL